MSVLAQDATPKAKDTKQELSTKVRGHVYRADTGAPIAKAKVTLYTAWASSNGWYPTAETDADGSYSFFDLRPNTYIPRASCEGFVTGEYSVDGTLDGKFLQLKSGNAFQNVDFHLAVAGVISGSVSDEHGAAVRDIEVSAVRVQFSPGGTEKLIRVQGTETDGQGNFRLTGLLPDSYFVCVNGPHGNTIPGRDYRETYYPEEASPKTAKRVSVVAADETKNINVLVRAEKRYRITGRVSGPGPLNDSGRYRYLVSIKGRNHTSSVQDDGSFTIPDIPAGDYTLIALAEEPPTYQNAGLGTATVHIADADAQVIIEVGGVGEVSGRAVLAGTQEPLAGLRLLIRSDDAGNGSAFDENGSFDVNRVLPGRYLFELTKTDRPIYLKQIRCSGRDYTFEPITIAPQQIVSDCEALLADDAGAIQGQVSADNKPVREFTALLIPEAVRLRKLARYTMFTKTDADGRFAFPTVIPGDYLLFVVHSSDDQAYFALDFADRNRGDAQRISVRRRQTQVVKLK